MLQEWEIALAEFLSSTHTQMDCDGGTQWVKWGEIIRKEEVIRLWAWFIQPARLQVITYADFTRASGLSLPLFLLIDSIRTWLVWEIGVKSEVSDPPLCALAWENHNSSRHRCAIIAIITSPIIIIDGVCLANIVVPFSILNVTVVVKSASLLFLL